MYVYIVVIVVIHHIHVHGMDTCTWIFRDMVIVCRLWTCLLARVHT